MIRASSNSVRSLSCGIHAANAFVFHSMGARVKLVLGWPTFLASIRGGVGHTTPWPGKVNQALYSPERFGKYVSLYDRQKLLRSELLSKFLDCIAVNPEHAADFYALLPPDFDAEISLLAATPEHEWVTVYADGLPNDPTGGSTARTVPVTAFEPKTYAPIALRVLRSLVAQ